MEDCIKLFEYLNTDEINIRCWPFLKYKEHNLISELSDIRKIIVKDNKFFYHTANISHHNGTIYGEQTQVVKITDMFISDLKKELMELAHKKALEDLKQKAQEDLKKQAQDVVTSVLQVFYP